MGGVHYVYNFSDAQDLTGLDRPLGDRAVRTRDLQAPLWPPVSQEDWMSLQWLPSSILNWHHAKKAILPAWLLCPVLLLIFSLLFLHFLFPFLHSSV